MNIQKIKIKGIKSRFLKALILLCILLVSTLSSKSQHQADDIPHEIMYDEPYAVNKFFIKFQPIYADVFVTNINAGFGVEGNYFYQDKANFQLKYRRAYARKFDIAKDVAEKNNNVDNEPVTFNFLELGGTYHINDFEEEIESEVFLVDSEQGTEQFATKAPETLMITVKRRRIYGLRMGGFAYQTSTDIVRVLDAQDITLLSNAGSLLVTNDLTVFSNLKSAGFYLGGSYTAIKNYGVKFADEYKPAGEDLILNVYLDIMFGLGLDVEDIEYQNEIYDASIIETNNIGFKLGIEGMFNRKLSWAYGSEIGFRPGIQKRSFFALIKLSFPVFGTDFKEDNPEDAGM